MLCVQVRDGPYKLKVDDFASDGPILKVLNQTWLQAKIQWELVGVTEHFSDTLAPLTLEQLSNGAAPTRKDLSTAVQSLLNPGVYQIFVHTVLDKHPKRDSVIQGFTLGSGPKSRIHMGAWSNKGNTNFFSCHSDLVFVHKCVTLQERGSSLSAR